MLQVSTSDYWLSPSAISITLNALGDKNLIQASVTSGAKLLCYVNHIDDEDLKSTFGYDAGHNYRRWSLRAYPTAFGSSSEKYVYLRIPRTYTADNAIAEVVYPPVLIDIYGRVEVSSTDSVDSSSSDSDTTDTTTTEPNYDQYASDDYYYIYLGGHISASTSGSRDWISSVDTGLLATDQDIAAGPKDTWYRYDILTDTVTFLKDVLNATITNIKSTTAEITNLIFGGKTLTGTAKVATISSDSTDDDSSEETESYETIEDAIKASIDQDGTSDEVLLTPAAASQRYLSRITDDSAFGNITFRGTITAEQLATFKSSVSHESSTSSDIYVTGMTGSGWNISRSGDAELQSLTVREFLEVPELRFNRAQVLIGTNIQSVCGGVIKSVTPTNNTEGVAELELGDDDIAGSIAVGDLCWGYFHDYSEDADTNNANADSDDHKGEINYKGFATVYFQVSQILNENSTKFKYELRPDVTDGDELKYPIHPYVGMHFGGRGNTTNKSRQGFTITTPNYTAIYQLVSSWDWSDVAKYIVRVSGKLDGFEALAGKSAGEWSNHYGTIDCNFYLRGNINTVSNNKRYLYITQQNNGIIGDEETENVSIVVRDHYFQDRTSEFTITVNNTEVTANEDGEVSIEYDYEDLTDSTNRYTVKAYDAEGEYELESGFVIQKRPRDGVSRALLLTSFSVTDNEDGTNSITLGGYAIQQANEDSSTIDLSDEDCPFGVLMCLSDGSGIEASYDDDGSFSDGGKLSAVQASHTFITIKLYRKSGNVVVASICQPIPTTEHTYDIVWQKSIITVEYERSMQEEDNLSDFSGSKQYVDRTQTVTNKAVLMNNGEAVSMSSPSITLSAPWAIDSQSYAKSCSVNTDGSVSVSVTMKATAGHAFRIDSDVTVSLTGTAPDGSAVMSSFALSPAAKGSEGDPGGSGTGITISEVTIKYGESTSGTTRPSSWSLTVPTVANGRYLWTWTHVAYSDGTVSDAYSVSRMGIDGGGVKSSDVDYYMSQDAVDVSMITDWGDFPSTLVDNYWLYIRTTITYSDNSTSVSYDVRRLGNGSFYAGLQEYYAIGPSDTEAPAGYPTKEGQNYPLTYGNGETVTISGVWSETRKYGNVNNPYIWNFEISYDSQGTKYVTRPICIGNYSKSIESIVETYAISASKTMREVSGQYYPPADITAWTDEQHDAAPTKEKPYQWNKTEVKYKGQTDPDVFYHVSAVRGDDGDTPTIGDDGYWYIGGQSTGVMARGVQGCVTVFMGKWNKDVKYVNESDDAEKIASGDVRYIHIVQLGDEDANNVQYFVRTKNVTGYTQTNGYASPTLNASNAYWQKMDMLGMIATDVLMSKDAWIDHLTGKAVYCTVNKSDSGATLASPIVQTGMQSVTDNSVPTIFAGADQSNATTAPFRVYKNGKLVAQNAEIVGKVTSTDADISGKVTATRGNIGGFEIGANALVNASNNASIEITDASQVTKIGASAVDAITSKKCSMSAVSKSTGTHNTALYLDAHGATYNYAFHGNGNGVLNGLVYGYKVSIMKLKTSADDMLYTTLGNGSTVILSGVNGNTVTGGTHCIALPKLSEVRQSLGISVSDTSTSFAIEITYINRCGYDGCWLCFKTDTHFGDNDALPYRMSGDNTNYTGTASRIHLQKGDISRLMLVYNHDTLDYCAYEISHLS